MHGQVLKQSYARYLSYDMLSPLFIGESHPFNCVVVRSVPQEVKIISSGEAAISLATFPGLFSFHRSFFT
jgi:hypothetical protein